MKSFLLYLTALFFGQRVLNIRGTQLESTSGDPTFYPGRVYITPGTPGDGHKVVPELQGGRLVRKSTVWPADYKGIGLDYAQPDGILPLGITQDDYSADNGVDPFFKDDDSQACPLSIAMLATLREPKVIEAGEAIAGPGLNLYVGVNGVVVTTRPALPAIALCIGISLEACPVGHGVKTAVILDKPIDPKDIAAKLKFFTVPTVQWSTLAAVNIPANVNLLAVLAGGVLQVLGVDYTLTSTQIIPTAPWTVGANGTLVLLYTA